MPINQRKPIVVIQGGQWGSEAKGMVTAALGQRKQAQVYVRTGTVNAGHTVYYKGKPYKMQQLPVGWVDPNADLVLGPGAYIHPGILDEEIRMVNEATGQDIRDRLYIDERCGIHLTMHTERSTESGRHHLMGATGKGCSEAVIDKIRLRGREQNTLYKGYVPSHDGHPSFMQVGDPTDTVTLLNDWYDMGRQIVIEGTQGTHLDLHLGPYPYTTHKQTQAANWAAECGMGLGAEWEVVLVLRTYPIRVAGNSGPMPREGTWQEIARVINSKLAKAGIMKPIVGERALERWEEACRLATMANWPEYEHQSLRPYILNGEDMVADHNQRNEFLSEMPKVAFNILEPDIRAELEKLFEFTTVTKKLRRVARFDPDMAYQAVRMNRPKYVVMTFMNYVFPEFWGRTGFDPGEMNRINGWLRERSREVDCSIPFATFGPEDQHLVEVY